MEEKTNGGGVLLQCIVAWFAAYAGMAALRAALVSLFLGHNEFAVMAPIVAKWTGLEQGQATGITPLSALKTVFTMLLSRSHTIVLLGLGLCFLVALAFRYRRTKRLSHPAYLCLLCALIPIVWACVTSRATQQHRYFQYRLLVTFVFAVFCFLASLLGNTKKQTLESALPEMPQTDE